MRKLSTSPTLWRCCFELLPLMAAMVEHSVTGVYNFVNPGMLSHNQLLELYKEHVDPSFAYKNFTIEEHDSILRSKRSNNWLDTTRLEALARKLGVPLPGVREAVVGVMKRIAAGKR